VEKGCQFAFPFQMDIIFFLTGPFAAFEGASIFAAIFYAASRLGKAASRASGAEYNS